MTHGHPGEEDTSSDKVIQTLTWIKKQGFRPVPLRFKSKAAATEKYVDVNYVPPSDNLWYNNNIGIGVVTGPKHSGPVDIDLDCPEAIFFATKFLPHTGAVFGRRSKRSSHYLYRVEEDTVTKKAYIDPENKNTIVEIRGDGGHQTVMPGSIHETTGELVDWSDTVFPEVGRVEYGDLKKAVEKIAVATLISRHLWVEGQRNETCKHLAGALFYLDWTEVEVTDLIAAVMEYTGDEDRTRLKTVSATFKKGERGGKITGSNTLKTMVADPKVVDKIVEWAGSGISPILQDYNEKYAVVIVEGKFRVAETDVPRSHPPVLYQKDDFLNYTETDKIVIDDKRVPASRVWLASPKRRTYKSMDYLPGVEETGDVLNLWSGWAVDPDPNTSCQAWLDLLFYVICGADNVLNQWMLNWFANIVRDPMKKPLTAPVIIGKQGAGKSLLFSYFGKILGQAYQVVTNEEHVYGRFNKHLATVMLLHSEEALYGGDKKHRSIIKSLITDDTRIFEQKGIDAKRVRNLLRLALTSNEALAAPVEPDDRRFTVINLHERKADEKLINAVIAEMNHGGPEALFHYLSTMEYDPRIIRNNIKNNDLTQMKMINFSPVETWWHETLDSGSLLPGYLSWAQLPEDAPWPDVVSSIAVYHAATIKMREQGARMTPSPAAFWQVMGKMMGMPTFVKIQKWYNNPMSDAAPVTIRLMSNRQSTISNFPSLDECRKAFERFVDHPIEWTPEDENDPGKPAYQKF